jgi:hypothetical protein
MYLSIPNLLGLLQAIDGFLELANIIFMFLVFIAFGLHHVHDFDSKMHF